MMAVSAITVPKPMKVKASFCIVDRSFYLESRRITFNSFNNRIRLSRDLVSIVREILRENGAFYKRFFEVNLLDFRRLCHST